MVKKHSASDLASETETLRVGGSVCGFQNVVGTTFVDKTNGNFQAVVRFRFLLNGVKWRNKVNHYDWLNHF
jgi:hypothetical protein